jgi:hypothetical protein
MFTGNRGCLVDDGRRLARHHRGPLWITCLTEYRGWHHELDKPRVWTPIFFLDEAVALAAGHRPCGLCRRDDYTAYRDAVANERGTAKPPLATDLNRSLQAERLRRGDRRGRGPGPWLGRARDRILHSMPIEQVPAGAVVVTDNGRPHLMANAGLQPFSFDNWKRALDPPPAGTTIAVLTPATSVAALRAGYRPRLHSSADY